jgi:acetyl esterase/lipase
MILDLHDPALAEHREEAAKFADAFEELTANRPPPDFSTPEGLAAARDISSYNFDAGDVSDLPVTPEDRVVRAGNADVGVRVFRPDGDARAVYLDIHGGGFYLGSASMGDIRNARCAETLGVAVVSVEYRLAPEHPWPAGPDDCETAAHWLLDHAADEFGADRLLIGGASAGANLAVATLLRVRDKHDAVDRFVGANLLYGPYDLSNYSPSGRIHEKASTMFRPQYMGHVPRDERTNPDISPLYADLHDMPSALFSVGTRDGLFEDSVAMAARWAAAGNECELDVYPDAPHGFDAFPMRMADVARDRTLRYLGARLE